MTPLRPLPFCALLFACTGTPTPLHPNLSGSVGLPHQGVQTHAVELPRSGPGFRRYRPYGTAYYAQPELVSGIEWVSLQMATQFPGGPDLVLGDLSAKHGGRIPRHNSHRSGRDVDLLWYLTSPAGRPLVSPGFLRVGADGLAYDPASGAFLRLDIPRQWAAVKAFLSAPGIHVQWMFCSRAIEAMLISYARARGEPDELVWRAETILLQPADSLPHDDHIHLRISCTAQTSLTGCEGGGPHWEWLPPLPSLSELTRQDLLEIGQQDPAPLQGLVEDPTSEPAPKADPS